MKNFVLFFTCMFASIFVYSQCTFERIYERNLAEYSHSIKQTMDGGYIIAGTTSIIGSSPTGVYLLKTNSCGDTLWSRIISKHYQDAGVDVLQLIDSGYIILAYATINTNNWDVFLIRTNQDGDTLWTKTIGDTINEFGNSFARTYDGGYIIAGQVSSVQGHSDIILFRTDSIGNLLWTKNYGNGSDDNIAYSVAQTFDSSFVITGRKYILYQPTQVFILKTNNHGDTIWAKCLSDTTKSSCGYSIMQTADSGLIVIGDCVNDIYLIKTNVDGDSLWSKKYGGSAYETGCAVSQTDDGGYILAGNTLSFGAGAMDYYIIKIDSAGNELWSETYGGSSDDECHSVMQIQDGGFVVSGHKQISNCNWDIYVVKTDKSGHVETSGNWEINENLELNIIPNPASSNISLQFSGRFGLTKKLEIFDCYGQLQLTKTGSFYDIDISSLTSGLYLIVLTNLDNERLTSKLIKE
ncbi:MAG TPA: T9SS type A sorting domain-containing protein [Bacteroidales bacterium]|nr:T9SS type A sorting domain-containing protein [Bacteroidales bacterium]